MIHKCLGRPLGGGKSEGGQAWALPKSYFYSNFLSPVILREVRRGDNNNPLNTITCRRKRPDADGADGNTYKLTHPVYSQNDGYFHAFFLAKQV